MDDHIAQAAAAHAEFAGSTGIEQIDLHVRTQNVAEVQAGPIVLRIRRLLVIHVVGQILAETNGRMRQDIVEHEGVHFPGHAEVRHVIIAAVAKRDPVAEGDAADVLIEAARGEQGDRRPCAVLAAHEDLHLAGQVGALENERSNVGIVARTALEQDGDGPGPLQGDPHLVAAFIEEGEGMTGIDGERSGAAGDGKQRDGVGGIANFKRQSRVHGIESAGHAAVRDDGIFGARRNNEAADPELNG
jgi:hypothetical protein